MNSSIKSVFKPVAFVLSKDKIDAKGYFFSDKINNHTIKVKDWFLKIWFIGDFEKSIENKINFSFPKSNNLLDRNLIISETNKIITIENDWLGSIPVFYNTKDLIISTIPNLCLKDNLFDEEGLVNFLEFGYSVFERTPFKNVEFLRYYSTLIIEGSTIKVEFKDDPVLNPELFNKQSTSKEAIDIIQEYITDVEQKVEGDIIIPTSGGYDSRLLNWGVNDKSRIRSFTYGLSKNQNESHEVVFARKISKILNIKWKQIELSNYNNYINHWHKMFGFSTHLHGMYHIEFYNKIVSSKTFDHNSILLSGIIGDAWAGDIKHVNIHNEKDLIKLGYSHGIFLDNSFFKKKISNSIRKEFFDKNNKYLNKPLYQIIFMMRIKIMLLSYLTSLPEYFGIPTSTPFLNFKNVINMLSLPKKFRKNRKWQFDLFKKNNLDVEKMNLSYSTLNSLNQHAANKFNFEPIKSDTFKNMLNIRKIEKLNKNINNQNMFWEFLLTRFKLRSILRKIGINKIGYLGSLSNYHILKAIEKSVKNEH